MRTILRKLLIASVILVCLGLSGGSGYPVTAQDASGITTFPVSFKGFAMRLSPDSKTLAIAPDGILYDSDSGTPLPNLVTIYLFDITTGKQIGTLSGAQSDFVGDMDFTPDGKTLASIHLNGQINLWDVTSTKLIKSFWVTALNVRRLQYLSDGKRLTYYTGAIPAVINVLDTETGYITAQFSNRFTSYRAFANNFAKMPGMMDISFSGAIAASPDGKWIATATQNDEVDLWDISTGEKTALTKPNTDPGRFNIRLLRFTPDGKALLYFYQDDKAFHLLDVTGKKDTKLTVGGGMQFGLSPKGDMLAWIDAGDKSSIYLWDFKADKPTKIGSIDTTLRLQPFSAVTFSADGKYLVIGNLAELNEKNKVYVINLSAVGKTS